MEKYMQKLQTEFSLKKITMRDRAIAALKRQPPYPGPIPHYDHLFNPLVESGSRRFHDLASIHGSKELDRALHEDAQLYVELAERFGWCGVRIHNVLELQPSLVRLVKELAGNRLLVESTVAISTLHIPSTAADMMDIVVMMKEEPEKMHAHLKKINDEAIELGKQLIDAGADAIDEFSDYCFNTGCWISPDMFNEFIFPYLHRITSEMKKAGAIFICHTDGDVMAILEPMIEAGIDALQSIEQTGNTSMAAVKAAVKGRICLIGNVPIDELTIGPESAIEAFTESAIRDGAPGGGFILSSANGMPDSIPLKHYLAWQRTWERFQYDENGNVIKIK